MAEQTNQQQQKQKRVCFAYPTSARKVIAIPNANRKEKEPIKVLEFPTGYYETDKPDEIAMLRAHACNIKNGVHADYRAFRELNDEEHTILTSIMRGNKFKPREYLEQLGYVVGIRDRVKDPNE